MSFAIADLDHTTWDVTWNSVSLGYNAGVDPSGIKLITMDRTIQRAGKIVVGKLIVGLEGVIKVTMEQLSLTKIKAMMPWAPGSGSIPLTPALVLKDLYDYAQILKLHPNVDGVTVTRDMNFLKAVPRIMHPSRDGTKQNNMTVEFEFFPDRTALETNGYPTYGYIGDIPS